MKDALGHGSNSRGGRLAKPIPGHPYHSKSDTELRYIQKDASEAGRNAQEMGDERGVNKYADQVNDASTVLGYRARGGSQDMPEPSNAAAARAMASGPKSSPVPTHSGMYQPTQTWKKSIPVRDEEFGGWRIQRHDGIHVGRYASKALAQRTIDTSKYLE